MERSVPAARPEAARTRAAAPRLIFVVPILVLVAGCAAAAPAPGPITLPAVSMPLEGSLATTASPSTALALDSTGVAALPAVPLESEPVAPLLKTRAAAGEGELMVSAPQTAGAIVSAGAEMSVPAGGTPISPVETPQPAPLPPPGAPLAAPFLPPVAPGPPALPPGSPPFTGNLLIADASNHRLLEVTTQGQVAWKFPGPHSLVAPGQFRFPDDAFFSPDGRFVAVSEESNQIVVVIDYASQQIIWQYGVPGHAGSDLAHFSNPDDARILPDGRVAVADIRNCRIMLISWDQKTVRALGRPGDCSGQPGSFAMPNGIMPLPNGHLLISEIRNRRVSEIDLDGTMIRSVRLPIHYPSDAFLTSRDTLIVADYHTPGRVIEADWRGHVLWSYPSSDMPGRLDKPSIASELPNGNIAICDDHRHRVLVLDRAGRTVWQYGVAGAPGSGPGFLTFPDGFDLHEPVALPVRVVGQ